MSKSSSPAPAAYWLLVHWTDGVRFHSMPCRLPTGPFTDIRELHYAGCVPTVAAWERGRYPWSVMQYRVCTAPRMARCDDDGAMYPTYDPAEHTVYYPMNGPYAMSGADMDASNDGLNLADLDTIDRDALGGKADA